MKFSVLLPTHNRLDLLSRAIETVKRQDYDNWEIIVSDNFSEEDVIGYVNSLYDSRIKYFRTDSFIPVTDNWNNALDKSDGDYVIMLGDDDGLLRGYFSTLSKLIEEFDSPDFVYTSACLYAYPGVIPGKPEGFLQTFSQRKIFHSAPRPFFLEKSEALGFVKDSLNFRVTFDYNMQFSLVSKKLIERMKQYGSFYQSPYPDYYASNAIMMKAERILIVPQPLVAIGISPKSFGFYYFNDAESEGNQFLNNIPDQAMVHRLKEVILPGVVMNTSWLISMETLAINFSEETPVKVNYARYRLVQLLSAYSGLVMGNEKAKAIYSQIQKKMNFGERMRFGLLGRLLSVLYIFVPKPFRASVAYRLNRTSGSHPGESLPIIAGQFRTILDVFKQIDPEKHSN